MAGESFIICETFSSRVMRGSRSFARRSVAAPGSFQISGCGAAIVETASVETATSVAAHSVFEDTRFTFTTI